MFSDESWLVKGFGLSSQLNHKNKTEKERKEKKGKTKKKGDKTIVCESLKNFSLAIFLLPIESAIWDYVETSFFW